MKIKFEETLNKNMHKESWFGPLEPKFGYWVAPNGGWRYIPWIMKFIKDATDPTKTSRRT